MKTWIFQANPARFDIDGYLATYPDHCVWQVNQHASEIRPGDRVYFWRSAGGEKGGGGIYAKCIVSSEVSERQDDERAKPFWTDKAEGRTIRPRVELDVIRIANKRQMLQRGWLQDDPVLRELPIFTQPRGTNFPVPPEQARRLGQMWARTGEDWTDDDSLAGLWAYAKTYGGEVYKLPGSPVAQVALMTGRAVSGVYNKVMNFRALDPRDQRAGMSGVGEADRRTWARFWDEQGQTLRLDALNEAFKERWQAGEGHGARDDAVELAGKSLEELFAIYQKRRGRQDKMPLRRTATVTQFERLEVVISIAKERAGYKCEVPGCRTPWFMDAKGARYCEVHHIQPLADDGLDTPENVACLCAQHHREIHLGARAKELRQQLRDVRRADKPQLRTAKAAEVELA